MKTDYLIKQGKSKSSFKIVFQFKNTKNIKELTALNPVNNFHYTEGFWEQSSHNHTNKCFVSMIFYNFRKWQRIKKSLFAVHLIHPVYSSLWES